MSSKIPGAGTPIGCNDKHGKPVHIGDTLRFDPNEWYRHKRFKAALRGEPCAPEKDPLFTVRIERGEIYMWGCPSDTESWCEIAIPWDAVSGGQYFAPDGTLMNANGTRSIFDDVDE
jgi:hypothetical protein